MKTAIRSPTFPGFPCVFDESLQQKQRLSLQFPFALESNETFGPEKARPASTSSPNTTR